MLMYHPTVRNKLKNLKKIIFCWHLESLPKREGSGSVMQWTLDRSKDPDPYQNVTESGTLLHKRFTLSLLKKNGKVEGFGSKAIQNKKQHDLTFAHFLV
jgi:hypothetical protein